jgi:hypothetical protein
MSDVFKSAPVFGLNLSPFQRTVGVGTCVESSLPLRRLLEIINVCSQFNASARPSR